MKGIVTKAAKANFFNDERGRLIGNFRENGNKKSGKNDGKK